MTADEQTFRDEALRVEVALDGPGSELYGGTMPASLYVERVGPASGKTVLYLHGGPGYSAASFREVAEEELSGFDVLYVDQRGGGRSTGEGGSDVGLLAADVVAVLDSVGVASATLVAHGFGAFVALRAARSHPERIARIVLVNPWVSMPRLAADLLSEAGVAEEDRSSEDPRAMADEAFAAANPKVLFDAMQFPSAASRMRLEHLDAVALSGEEPDDVDDAVWLLDASNDLLAVQQAEAPIFMLFGESDRTSYPGQAEIALELVPRATFGLLAGGHYPWLDDDGFFDTLGAALTSEAAAGI